MQLLMVDDINDPLGTAAFVYTGVAAYVLSSDPLAAYDLNDYLVAPAAASAGERCGLSSDPPVWRLRPLGSAPPSRGTGPGPWAPGPGPGPGPWPRVPGPGPRAPGPGGCH